MENMLRPFWKRFFTFNWKFGIFLIVLFCVPRFLLVLHANETANYKYIGLIMTAYALAPFIFLTKQGRTDIGFTKPTNYYALLLAIGIGIAFSVLLYGVGTVLYGHSLENWYVYIGKSYNIPIGIDAKNKLIMFSIMAITGMLFSPIGEELLFRGVIHTSVAKSVGNQKASLVDSAAFALTHISHFGLVFINQQWHFFTLPTLLWVLGMFVVSILFYKCRKLTGSLLGAVCCHAAFNFGMTYCIFYLI